MTNPPHSDRYEIVLGLLQQILRKVEALERDFDEIDRTVLRPYGDGTKVPPRERRCS